jgi:hypothetical protein
MTLFCSILSYTTMAHSPSSQLLNNLQPFQANPSHFHSLNSQILARSRMAIINSLLDLYHEKFSSTRSLLDGANLTNGANIKANIHRSAF